MQKELETFKSLLIERYKLDSSAIEYLISNISVEHYSKRETLLKEQQYCKTIKFVLSGIYRVYQIQNGKEITSYFNYNLRNPFLASTESLLKNTPSKEYIECIESGTLLSIDYQKVISLFNHNLSASNLGRLIAEQNYLLSIERIEYLQFKNATERYNHFIKTYPTLLNKIPHHYIASYVGITPESLSRIRKKSMHE